MATFNANFTFRQTSKFLTNGNKPTTVVISDTPETIKVGILSAGVIPIKQTRGTPANTTWLPFSTASDISGYQVLQTGNSGINLTKTYAFTSIGGTYPEYSAYEKFVTAAGGMDAVYANSVSTNFLTTAWNDVAGINNDVRLECYIYHYPSGELLIDNGSGMSFEDILNTTAGNQFTDAVAIAKKWGTNERLDVRYRFVNYGIPV